MFRKLSHYLIGASLLTAAQFASADSLVIGGKDFTEQLLLTSITEQYLSHAGVDVKANSGMGTAVLRKAQENGQIDLCWEYTGTSLIVFNKINEHLDPAATYAKVKELDAKKGLTWMAPSQVNNTYAIAIRTADAESKNIKTLSQLATALNGGSKLTLAVNPEFPARSDGLKPLSKAYGFEIPREDVIKMDTGLVYTALKEGKVDLGLVFATDGRIPAFKLLVLDDDKQYFPSYQLAPVIRDQALAANPKLTELMAKLTDKLNNQQMATLNAQVDVDKKSIESVAKSFLQENGLI
jgi:osmoprotectant transport system substrate-binding protein